ncbi:hypothetical protein BJ742DRAFT_744004 [Cladochytrium replicatum]|nr:hypothetical protein BJ742DRAFT_744004 [Cladochytrium replicatum]
MDSKMKERKHEVPLSWPKLQSHCTSKSLTKSANIARNERRELDANNIKLRHSNAILKLKASSQDETMSKIHEINGDDHAESSNGASSSESRERSTPDLSLESRKDLLKSKGAVNKLNTDNSYFKRVLEIHLIETNIGLEEAKINAADLRQARILDERNTSAIEWKYIIAKEMVEKVKQEKYELQKANYELRDGETICRGKAAD